MQPGRPLTSADRLLTVRNRIYQTVFNEAWVRKKMPLDTRWIIVSSAAALLIAIFAAYYLYFFPHD